MNYSTATAKLRAAAIATIMAFTVLACGGGSNLADQAEEQAAKQCECVDFDCTLAQTQWFNKTRATQEDDIAALSDADEARYDAASSTSSGCQNALRP